MDGKNYAKIFADNLKVKRKIAGLTQRQLAEKLGYTEKSVSKWESGESITPSFLLPSLAELLGVSIDELMNDRSNPEYFLGVDGGGTKTEFILCDKNQKMVSRIVLSGCNPVDIGIEKCFAILKEGIETVCDGVPFSSISAFVGIAGGISGDYKKRVADFLSAFHFAKVQNGSDAENAVAAALGNADGIAVIAGTGTIAFIKQGSELQRVGGWGYLLEEGGSGFAVGRDAVYAALLFEEGAGENISFYDAVKNKCGTETVLSAIADIYKGGKKKLASFAPIVFEAADAKDPVALEILRKNSKALAALINRAKKLSGKDEVTAVIAGGLMSRSDVMLPLIKEHLDQNITIGIYTDAPVNGALSLARLQN